MTHTPEALEGAARGFVCAKHEEFCPSGVCRWCEPVRLAPAVRTCRMRDRDGLVADAGGIRRCGKPAAWEWVAVTEHAKRINKEDGQPAFCQKCHDIATKDGGPRALAWRWDTITSGVAAGGPQP